MASRPRQLFYSTLVVLAGCATPRADPIWSAVVIPDKNVPGRLTIELVETPAVALTLDRSVSVRKQIESEMRVFAERLVAERHLCRGPFSGPELAFMPASNQLEPRFSIHCLTS
jgi:hypothetical protein